MSDFKLKGFVSAGIDWCKSVYYLGILSWPCNNSDGECDGYANCIDDDERQAMIVEIERKRDINVNNVNGMIAGVIAGLTIMVMMIMTETIQFLIYKTNSNVKSRTMLT